MDSQRCLWFRRVLASAADDTLCRVGVLSKNVFGVLS